MYILHRNREDFEDATGIDMSGLAIAFPAEVVVSVSQQVINTTVSVVRPLMSAGAVAAALLLFRPLGYGMAKAMWLMAKPRQSIEQRVKKRILRRRIMLSAMAESMQEVQPSHAQELRMLSAID